MGIVTFQQLGRPNRRLALSGRSAPHGRARKDVIVTPEQRIRESEAMLPGSDEPVIHVFGQRREPIKFHGRLRDSGNGKGFAHRKYEEIASFVGDQQICRITWDDVIDIHGLIVAFVPKIEAKYEIEYELEIKVIRNLLDPQIAPVVPVKGPADITNQILDSLKLKDKLPFEPPTLKGSVVDLLNAMVGDVNSASAVLVEASNDIDSFATGTIAALQRFRAGLGQLNVAVSNLRGTYDNMLVQTALENETANQAQPWWDLQAAWADSSLEAIRLMAAAEREAAKAEQGQLLALHEAGDGDTWQSIAIRWYGSGERAGEIRRANGVDEGLEPTPGTVYFVPR